MKNDNLNTLFKNLENDFDIESPGLGHQQRFLDKLNNQSESIRQVSIPHRSFWKPLIGIAASIVLLISLFIGLQQDSNSKDLASVSPEMENTQNFFSNVIAEELSKLEVETFPEAQILIKDAMTQIKILEMNYEQLKQNLNESGEDKRVIYAMITNFQNRIDVLQNVLQQIEDVKQLKNNTYENSTTI
ncbi:MAG: hypothetical protein KAJ28_06490 [Flavobacteriaceae bacterium]|nr:hypothetical protein [Flavobacteriaceae bacterium]